MSAGQFKEELAQIAFERHCLEEMLKLIQAEINKYEIEKMHFKSLTAAQQEAGNSVEMPVERTVDELIREFDDADAINKKSLELSPVKKWSYESEEDDDM